MKIPPFNLWTVNQAWLLALALAIAPMKGAALRVGAMEPATSRNQCAVKAIPPCASGLP